MICPKAHVNVNYIILYVDNQIQLEDSAIEYEDINYINKMIESSIVNYITGE